MNSKLQIENVIIIGGGVAGLSAAIYNARANLKPLVFAGSPPGGQLTLTSQVENYPGFESISGAELVEKMRNQAEKFGARIIDENVVKVDFSKRPFKIYLSDSAAQFSNIEKARHRVSRPAERDSKQMPSLSNNLAIQQFNNIFYAKSIIVATGAKALWLGLESEKRLRGKGVSACATCDGFFFQGKTVAVVGGGDTAMEDTLILTKFVNKVYLIHRRDQFRASKIMIERVLNNPKVEIIYNTVVEEVLGKDKVEGIRLKRIAKLLNGQIANKNNLTMKQFNNETILKADGLFIAIGHKPDTDIFKGQIEMDEEGYISISNYRSGTSVPGVFAAGDCIDSVYQQAAVAAGMGVMAALDVEKYL